MMNTKGTPEHAMYCTSCATYHMGVLAWPLHKDDMLFQSGRPMGLNIYFAFLFLHLTQLAPIVLHTPTFYRDASFLFNAKY